jgi:hypothetical protein
MDSIPPQAPSFQLAIVGLLLADLLIAVGGLPGLRDAVLSSISGPRPNDGPRHA